MNLPSSYDRVTIGGLSYPPMRIVHQSNGDLNITVYRLPDSVLRLGPIKATVRLRRPASNRIRVVHGDARLRGMDLQHISGLRWRTATLEPARVRVCRGSRR